MCAADFSGLLLCTANSTNPFHSSSSRGFRVSSHGAGPTETGFWQYFDPCQCTGELTAYWFSDTQQTRPAGPHCGGCYAYGRVRSGFGRFNDGPRRLPRRVHVWTVRWCPPRPQEQGPEIQDDGPTAEADTHKRAAPRPAYTPFERTHSSLHSVTHEEPRPITVAQWSLPVFTSWMHERNRAPALY